MHVLWRNGHEPIRPYPIYENCTLYEAPPPQGLSEARLAGKSFLVTDPPRGRPVLGRRHSSHQMNRVLIIPASKLNTMIFIGKPRFFYKWQTIYWRRGQCLCPQTAPALYDDDVVPVRYHIRGEHKVAGEKIPVSVQVFLKHFSGADACTGKEKYYPRLSGNGGNN